MVLPPSSQKIVDRRLIGRAKDARIGEQRLDLGSKQEHVILVIPVQRLDAVPVPRQEQLLARPVPDSKGKHAVEVIDAIRAPFLVSVNDHLGVGLRMKLVAARLQFHAQFLKVVNLAVEGNDHVAIFIGHRLMAARRQVDDRQPAMAQPDRAGEVARQRVFEALQANQFDHLLRLGTRRGFSHIFYFERKLDILDGSTPRHEVRGLKDHANARLFTATEHEGT